MFWVVCITDDHEHAHSVAVTITSIFLPVPDLPLCLGVLKHKAPLARRGGHLPAEKILRWIFAYVVQFQI
jgi:hypothetical protein